MDALAKLNEHFLSCTICTETFKDPCTLGCYHTFCKPCLTKYTHNRRDAISAKSILCPNCCQMTKVPRPQEPVDQWSHQFKPSFLIQGLLDSFASQECTDPVEHCCFICQHNSKTTQANSICEDCDIMICEACTKIHVAAPNGTHHVISTLESGSNPHIKKRKVMCKEHNCLVEFCCSDCQKVVCHLCCFIYHRKCHSVVTLDSMIPEMKQVLQQNHDDIELHRQQTGNTLKSERSEVEEITQHKSSLQSEIRRVSQQAVNLIRRKEKKLLDELDTLTEKQTGELRGRIQSGEIDLQTYQQFIKQVLQSNTPTDLYDMYRLCQSREITAKVKSKDKQGKRTKKIEFENQLDVDQLERILQLGRFKLIENMSILQDTPKLLSTVSAIRKGDVKVTDFRDIVVLDIDGTDTLVVPDLYNKSVKSLYTKDNKAHCTSLNLKEGPFSLTKITQDRVAVTDVSHHSFVLIKLTPDPVRVSTIKTKKKYICLTALSDKTVAAGCIDPPSIDVLDLSGRVLRSVITSSTGQHLIQRPWYMCTTRQGHIVVSDAGSRSVYCVTQQGEVLYTNNLTGDETAGVTTTDTGSVIVANHYGNKIVQLTERGEYVRDLLTERDGIVTPQGICVHGNKLYVTESSHEHVKIFQL